MAIKKDNVKKPKHYNRYKIQPLDFIMANNIPYCEANAIKYLCRWEHKHPTWEGKLEDLLKAREYIDRRIKQVEEIKRVDDIDPLQIV
tara:strand:- start:740 stop:1003 length:264 start_codon:yes stop_codon:yes gene_type:complete